MTNFHKVAAACLLTALAASAQDRLIQPIDRGRLTTLKGHVHPKARAAADQGPVDPNMPIRHATLLFKPSAALDSFLAEQQNPASPNYRKWLTPEQFGDRFGLTANDISQVTGWLESQGLKVDTVARGRHWISFNGTADQAARTFRTRFHRFLVDGKTHFANIDEPAIPAALESVVCGFLGLDDFKLTSQAARPLATSSKGEHSLAPDDLAAIYNIAPLYAADIDGAGQKIAIIGDSSLDLSDLRAFRSQFHLPYNDPIQLLIGDDPGYNGDVVEANLDIEWANAIAPAAQIVYVYGQDVFFATQYAIDDNVAPVLSLSFGGCEAYNWASFRGVAQQASAQGITWLAASGDAGAAQCDTTSNTPQAAKGLSVIFPASIPEITAVGGTQVDDTNKKYWSPTNTANGASALGYIPETVWNDNSIYSSFGLGGFSGAGGGASILFSKPTWQTGPGVPNDKARDIPDVSLAASPNHAGYQIYLFGGIEIIGGTSASAPVLAGVVSLLNHYLVSKSIIAKPGLGNINPTLYRLAQSTNNIFHDITAGDNAVPCALGTPNCVEGTVGYKAAPGFDLATGLGSIDAYNLVTQWSIGTASTTTVTADLAKAAMDDSVNLTVTVRGAGAGVAPTGTVSFLVQNLVDDIVGTASLTAGGATIAIPASSIIGGDGKVTALYSGDKLYNASSGTVIVGVKRPADGGSLVIPYITPNPVHRQTPYGTWPYDVVLTERGGVQTTLTAFTINGVSNLSSFGNGAIVIPAKGTLAASFAGRNLTVPLDRVFHFEGKDLDGTKWTRDITVPFLDAVYGGAASGMVVRSATATVIQNPKADPTCQFSHRLILQETGGFLMQLATLRQGNTDLTSSIQQIFGTSHLAPFGTLQGDLCFNSTAALGAKTYTVTASNAELGDIVTATLNVTLAAAAAVPTSMSVTPQTVTLPVADAFRSAATDVALNFSGPATTPWAASVLPGAPWLTVSPVAGLDSATLKITVNAAGLSRGAYQGFVSVQSNVSIPQAIQIPVTFVVGNSQTTTITAVANGASYSQAFAPGTLMTVFGTELAGKTRSAGGIPLPLDLNGVSATVNGVSAPLYYVSPGQLNVQIPYETGIGRAVLGVNNNGQVASYPFNVAPSAPGLFTAADGSLVPSSTVRQGQTAVAFITGDGDTTTFLITGSSPPSGTATSRLPRPRLPVTVTVAGINAPVTFAGTPAGLSGVSQVNFTVPTTVPVGVQSVVIAVGGVRTQSARLTVTQ